MPSVQLCPLLHLRPPVHVVRRFTQHVLYIIMVQVTIYHGDHRKTIRHRFNGIVEQRAISVWQHERQSSAQERVRIANWSPHDTAGAAALHYLGRGASRCL